MKVRFLEPALDEFLRSVDFYEQNEPGLGAALTDELDRIVAKISETPALGIPFTESTRRFPLSRFPYSIIYSIEPDAILVVALAHQRRKPGYWLGRLESNKQES